MPIVRASGTSAGPPGQRRPAEDFPLPPAVPPDSEVVAGLRAGDEACFAVVVDAYSSSMLRVAEAFVPSRAVAEEVVQDTWLALLRGLAGFEGRSALRTWLFRILVNTAKTRGARERRTVPFSALGSDGAGPAVEPDRFRGPGDEWPGHWASPPRPWGLPEASLLTVEVRDVLQRALRELPVRQRTVVVLRDVQGIDAAEVCDLLDLSEVNQRVLLHRGRARLRTALERYLDVGETA